jgi:hypothetical protein
LPAEGGDLFERACSLYRTGRTLEARDAYIELLKREPGHLLALNHLGSLLYDTGYRTAARTAYAEAVARHPDDVMSRVNLANALRESGDASESRRHYEAALRVQPEHREANQGLANLLADAGDHSGAAELWRRGFEKRPIVTTPYRGERPAVSVLLLATPARGNVQMRHFLDDTVFQTHIVYVDYLQHAQPLPVHNLVINAIGDADLAAPALHAAQALLARTSAPVMNAPGAVLATGRAETAARLNGIPGLVTPRTVTLPRVMLEGIEGHGFSFPLLVRTPGFHTGLHFERVESAAELPAKLAALPGDELTAIEYLDARGADGKTRKYRTMMIDGELYPLHAAVSSDWKIHYFTAEMADHPEHRAEDLEFLENIQGLLGAKAMNALREIQARLGLDYAGIDFGLNRNGDVLFFEANATMVVNRPEPDEKWAYRRPAVERIYAAVREMLLRKCGVG